jgi:hypothetical protein
MNSTHSNAQDKKQLLRAQWKTDIFSTLFVLNWLMADINVLLFKYKVLAKCIEKQIQNPNVTYLAFCIDTAPVSALFHHGVVISI